MRRPGAAGEAAPPRGRRRLADLLLGRAMTLAVAVVALLLGIATFILLSNGSPFGPTKPGQLVAIVLVNAVCLLLLGVSLISRLVRVWAERRRGSAGSRLHVRLVMLFGVVAVTPALLVAIFAAVFFNLGIQSWFSDRVRGTLEASLIASRAYLDEHRNTIRADALAMAADLNRNARLLEENQFLFAQILATHTALRGLTDSVVFDPATYQVVSHAGLTTTPVLNPLPSWAMEQARLGDVAVMPSESEEGRVRAVIQLDIGAGLMLLIGRPVDPGVIEHMQRTEREFQEYDQLDRNRSGLQITFALIFAIAALLVLMAAVLVGLVIANQIARPLARLIVAADRVRGGDLTVRVAEGEAEDEMGTLSRAFNRMTNQLAAQRSELMEAYRQIDERRRFTETVLSGVTAGVVGLDAEARINLPNRSASELLGLDLEAHLGHRLADVAPDFAPLLDQALASPEGTRTAEIRIGGAHERRTLLARIGAETQHGRVMGFVLTFDDITELLSAQRKAAWSDVARRIAHEIKNPLTPIQLSAERLKRRYLKQITSDPETFVACTDTIVRQVGDIGRMVDEFSAFARMPQPVMRPEPPDRMAREALVLQQQAHPDITFTTRIPEAPPPVLCDRRLLGQALTNLLANAADAVRMRRQTEEAEGRAPQPGHITLSVEPGEDWLTLAVEDDGIGLPQGEERERLTEPYVTHKPKGTGLGLAIVKKIMEDHGGRLLLSDRPAAPAGGRGTVAALVLPLKAAPGAGMEMAGKSTEMQRHGA